MQRFFVPPQILPDTKTRLIAPLQGDTARQIIRVLRMSAGDEVILLDGRGYEYKVRLTAFGKDEVWGDVLAKQHGIGEPIHNITLYLSLLNKAEKFEWALQKCTELGAARFVPVIAERSVSAAPARGKQERWERIIREAAEQSGRCLLPVLKEAIPLKQALKEEKKLLADNDYGRVAIMPAPGADMRLAGAFEEVSSEMGSAGIFIGPEGGFTDDELYEANCQGIGLVNLGPRILRAETAAVAALTLVMSALGEMG